MSEEETHIRKKRTTALKIIVDERIRNNKLEQRAFLANIFDYPEYTIQEEDIFYHCTATVKGEPQDYILYPEVVAILKENGIDASTFKGYREEKKPSFKISAWELDKRVKEATAITEDTFLHYKFASSEQNNGVTIYFVLFHLETTGKTKTEIKAVHKENVCKLLNYLRMRKVPVSYDCEWSFEGNRACQL